MVVVATRRVEDLRVVKVDVFETRIVEVEELVISTIVVEPADVWVSVAVTGQIVVDSSIITVVITSLTVAGADVVKTMVELDGVVETVLALEDSTMEAEVG